MDLSSLLGPLPAHVDYVTEGPGDAREALVYALKTLSDPLTAALFVGGGLAVLVLVGGWLWRRPTVPDLVVLRDTLAGYRDLVPWMLRLAMGLPLLGAGFAGYFFSPVVAVPGSRLALILLGFLLLFGLATRASAAAALLIYLAGLSSDPTLVLAFEYVGGLVALVLLGGGRPSADHMLGRVGGTEGTLYNRVDPVHRLAERFRDAVRPYERYAPTVIRVGTGLTFAYLGVAEKLLDPGRAALVVEKYDLTAVVPVSEGAWVLGAGLVEVAVGLAFVAGLLTRGTAALAFVVLTTTLFGLPDDPVLAHVTLFGLVSAVFTLGAGPLSLDRALGRASGADRPARSSARDPPGTDPSD
jgi:uncharacterized membrane protein YphA (DoxX/SURF4 family)